MLAGEEETVVKKTSKSSEPAGACALVSSEVFDKVDTDDLTAVAGPSGAPLSCKDNKGEFKRILFKLCTSLYN